MADSNTNNARKATKHTRVILPGGIQGLVRDLQNGTNRSAQTVVEQSDNQDVKTAEEKAPKMSQQAVDGVGEQAAGGQQGGAQREKTEAISRTENGGAEKTTQVADSETVGQREERNAAGGRYATDEPRQTVENQRGRVGEQSADEALANAREKAVETNEAVSPSENRQNNAAFEGNQNQSGAAQNRQDAQGAGYGQQGRGFAAGDQQGAGQVNQQGAGYGQQGRGFTAGDQQGAAAGDQQGQAQPQGRGRRPKENTMKSYTIVKDDSRDSWELFLDMAKQYKDGGGKLATIYIDGQLKNLLDRMKYVGPEKLTTSAILSSIVARFIYDHEDEIRKVLFSGDLL
jgi:hypothetical protein